MIDNGFESVHTGIGILSKNLDEMGSRVDNLATAINLLTNVQGLLVDKVVDYRVKDYSGRNIAQKYGQDGHIRKQYSRRSKS